MQTVLRSESKQVTIRPEGPVIVIGEKLNPTGHKRMALALQENDDCYILELARQQVAYGADVLDLNVGVAGLDEISLLRRLAKIVSAEVDLPLCLDSPNPAALASALEAIPGKPLVNSVSGEESRLRAVLPIVKERGAAVIALAMDDEGIPASAEGRLAVAARVLERAAQLGIPAEDIVVDPLVMTVGAQSQAAAVTLEAIRQIRRELGVNVVVGASNVSFGLPNRLAINQAFLPLAIAAGATCVISDPMKLAAIIKAADLLLGRDEYAARYIRFFRSLPKED